ncbi:MAG: hypothetical protein Q8P42_06050, partial [Gallionella sp.]|nr:hypothetical protein [Gallionella sp.]
LRPKRVKQAGNDENRVENSGICLFFVQSLAGATVCCSGNFKSDRLLAHFNQRVGKIQGYRIRLNR